MIKHILPFNTITYILIIICTTNVLSQSSDCDKVVGKWITKDKKTGIEFFEDGNFKVIDIQRCRLQDSEIYITGKWFCSYDTNELKLFDLNTEVDEQTQVYLGFLQFKSPDHIQLDKNKIIFRYLEHKTEIDLYERFLDLYEESPLTSEELIKTYKDIKSLKERGYITDYILKKISSFPKKRKNK